MYVELYEIKCAPESTAIKALKNASPLYPGIAYKVFSLQISILPTSYVPQMVGTMLSRFVQTS